ncbi:MAG: PD40 domain-containing protein [Alphaproteobacteria bacterium]|nr:PD40 domain-containing protein [Alphaproteobacteria bacterium]
MSIWLMAALPALAAGAAPVSPEVTGNAQHPLWSPDGARLSYEINDHEAKTVTLFLYDPGRGPTKVSPSARGASSITAGFSTSPASQVVHELSWSPPSQGTFVYSASGADQDYDLYLGTGSAIAAFPGADGGPAWSPDGKHIAFTSARTGQGDVYLLRVDDLAAPPRQLSDDPTSSEVYVTWSPDSARLAWVGHNKTGDAVYMLDSLDGKPRALASFGHTQTRPSFSPDGRSLAFYSDHLEPGRFDLWITPLDGPPRKLVEKVVLNDAGPQWTSDGRVVYVLDDDDRFDPVYVIDPKGGPGKPVPTRTVGNGDHHVVRAADGTDWLAVAAQGELYGQDRDYKRIYVMQLP